MMEVLYMFLMVRKLAVISPRSCTEFHGVSRSKKTVKHRVKPRVTPWLNGFPADPADFRR